VLRDAHLTCIYAGIDASPALPLEKAIDQEEYWFMRPIDTEVPIGEDSEDGPTADRPRIAALEWDDEAPALTLAREMRRRGLPITLLDRQGDSPGPHDALPRRSSLME